MKLSLFLRYLVINWLLISCSSCQKYLDIKSNATLVVPKSLENLQGILDDAGLINMQISPSFGEASADDYFLLPGNYNRWSRTTFIGAYTWEPINYYYSNGWSGAYQVIYNANLCLEQIVNIPMTTQNELVWKTVKGSALFFRAYNLLNLLWVYAKAYDSTTAGSDLGVVLRKVTNFNVLSVRSSVKDSYQQVINDAMEAANDLPANPQYVTRPSRAAAYGLLARAYLSMRRYDSAFKYADLSLQIKSDLLDYNTVQVANDIPFQPFNPEIIFYTEMNGRFPLINPFIGNIDTLLYSKYDPNDLRKAVLFKPRGGYPSFKGSYAASSYILFSGIATDEMYLIRAEGYARLGNKENALTDLNTLLKMRYKTGAYIPLTAGTAQDALNIILLERRKELLMRGLRWMDIKRLNKEGGNIIPTRLVNGKVVTLPPNDKRYALPLPNDLIEHSNLQQN